MAPEYVPVVNGEIAVPLMYYKALPYLFDSEENDGSAQKNPYNGEDFYTEKATMTLLSTFLTNHPN